MPYKDAGTQTITTITHHAADQSTNTSHFQVFRFMDLPAELREMVYDYAFPSKVLRIRRTKVPGSRQEHEITARSVETRKDGIEREYTSIYGPNGTSLLRVSRQISKEAMASLFGRCVFTFAAGYNFKHVSKMMGAGISLIRQIRFYTVDGYPSPMRYPQDLTSLQSIEFICGASCFLGSWLIHQASVFVTCHKSLKRQRSALEKIRFVPGFEWGKGEKIEDQYGTFVYPHTSSTGMPARLKADLKEHLEAL